MSEEEKPTVAFILPMIGGIFILLEGRMMSMVDSLSYGGDHERLSGLRYGGYGGTMGRYWYAPEFGMTGGYGFGFGLFGVVGILSGIVVIVSALMLYNHRWATRNGAP